MLVIWDFMAVAISIMAGFKMRFGFVREVPAFYITNMATYIVLIFALVLLFNVLCKNYNNILRHIGFTEVVRQAEAVFLVMVAMFVLDRVFTIGMPFEVMILTAIFLMIFTMLGRLSVKIVLYFRNKYTKYTNGENMSRVLIYGAGELGVYLQHKLATHPQDGLLPVLFVDDDRSLWNKKINGIKVVAPGKQLEKLLDEYDIDEVLLAVSNIDKEKLKSILKQCKHAKCPIRRFGTLDDFSQNNLDKIRIKQINLEDLLRRNRVDLNMDVVKNFVKDKTVLVTGGVGSIGSEICRQVLQFGAKKLVIFDINENGLFYFDNELKEDYDTDRYELRLGSIRDRKRMEEIFTEFSPEIVVHAAAHKHVPMMEINPREAIKNNVFGTLNVAQTAILHKVNKFILISTDKAVNPTNIMGASKRITELLVQMLDTMSDTEFAAVRFGNVLGSNGSVVPFFQKQIETGGPVTVTHPEMQRYFMTIPEACQLVLEAGAMAHGGEIFVLDMGQPVKIYDLACDLIRLNGLEPGRDIKIIFTGLRPGEKLFEEISLDQETTTKTTNNKIFINKPVDNDFDLFSRQVKDLEVSAMDEKRGIDEMFGLVGEIVPTFHHNKEGGQLS